MNNFDNEYKCINSIVKNPSPLGQKVYDLQAKAECAAENGDLTASQYFGDKIQEMVDSHPELQEDINTLAKYLGV